MYTPMKIYSQSVPNHLGNSFVDRLMLTMIARVLISVSNTKIILHNKSHLWLAQKTHSPTVQLIHVFFSFLLSFSYMKCSMIKTYNFMYRSRVKQIYHSD